MVLSQERINKLGYIVLGDIPEDVEMARNLKKKIQISIGFMNKGKSCLEHYLSKYDVVITGDGSFKEVNRILNAIINW